MKNSNPSVEMIKIPESLRESAYWSGDEPAWSAVDAVEVIRSLPVAESAVWGIEVWLPTTPGPTIPAPFIYTWSAEQRAPDEDWKSYARRVNEAATRYVTEFSWDPLDTAHSDLTPYFNLEFCEASDR